jgi:hypothetical protein
MKTKIPALLLLFFLTASAFSQSNLNKYKYIIVPSKYDFFKDKDQYQLNSLTSFLFNKYGFEALVEGTNYPDDLLKNSCLALKSDLINDSGMFKTKLTIELKDCHDQVVFTSGIGESREKEYDIAYKAALRNAFESIEALSYKYEPSTESLNTESQEGVVTSEVANEIQRLKEEIQSLKKEKEVQVVEKSEPMIESIPEMPVKESPVKETKTLITPVKEIPSGMLYAQEIENGFQLVDSSPKVVYKIKKTGIVDVFLVENKNATLYKKGADWILEYYENDVLKQDVLNIKF